MVALPQSCFFFRNVCRDFQTLWQQKWLSATGLFWPPFIKQQTLLWISCVWSPVLQSFSTLFVVLLEIVFVWHFWVHETNTTSFLLSKYPWWNGLCSQDQGWWEVKKLSWKQNNTKKGKTKKEKWIVDRIASLVSREQSVSLLLQVPLQGTTIRKISSLARIKNLQVTYPSNTERIQAFSWQWLKKTKKEWNERKEERKRERERNKNKEMCRLSHPTYIQPHKPPACLLDEVGHPRGVGHPHWGVLWDLWAAIPYCTTTRWSAQKGHRTTNCQTHYTPKKGTWKVTQASDPIHNQMLQPSCIRGHGQECVLNFNNKAFRRICWSHIPVAIKCLVPGSSVQPGKRTTHPAKGRKAVVQRFVTCSLRGGTFIVLQKKERIFVLLFSFNSSWPWNPFLNQCDKDMCASVPFRLCTWGRRAILVAFDASGKYCSHRLSWHLSLIFLQSVWTQSTRQRERELRLRTWRRRRRRCPRGRREWGTATSSTDPCRRTSRTAASGPSSSARWAPPPASWRRWNECK